MKTLQLSVAGITLLMRLTELLVQDLLLATKLLELVKTLLLVLRQSIHFLLQTLQNFLW